MKDIRIVSQEDLDKIYSNQDKILSKLDELLSVKPPVIIPEPEPEIPVDPVPEPPVIEEPSLPENPSKHPKFEDFGANSFYKEFTSGIEIKGNRVIGNGFTEEYVGKKFCGILSHQNPNTEDRDLYYPSMLASRYATVTKVISANEVELDFSFNLNSKQGYFFFDNSAALKKALESNSEVIILKNRATYVIPEYSRTARGKNLVIKQGPNGSKLVIGYECYFQWAKSRVVNQDRVLIDTKSNNVNIVFDCTVSPPYTSITETFLFNRDLFLNDHNNKDQVAVLGLMNSDALISPFGTALKGWGFGLNYSGKDIYNVAINVKNRGNFFMQPKSNNAEGSISMVLDKCEIHETPKELTKDFVLVDGIINKNGIFEITSNNTLYQIFNSFMFPVQWGNGEQIVHIDRFVFPLRTKNVQSGKSVYLEIPRKGDVIESVFTLQGLMGEYNPGDKLKIGNETYTVLTKNRAPYPYYHENNYTSTCGLDKPLADGTYSVKVIESTAESILGKEQPAYLAFKGNAIWLCTVDTKFGESGKDFNYGHILWSPDTKALFYPHMQANIWAKDVIVNGFYRMSYGVGAQKYCNIVNVKNVKDGGPDFGYQFNEESQITINMPMPPKIVSLLSQLNAI